MAKSLTSSVKGISLTSDVCIDWKVIAAIDFGTSNSGFAFAFQDSSLGPSDVPKIHLNKWQVGSVSSTTDKTPTTVLLNPDQTFHSFGYKAESHYAKLCDQKKDKGWWYFQQFKMLLYDTKLSREKVLYDTEGKGIPAIQVFSIAIGHLKECILNDVRMQNSDIKDEEVLYVLTVPAIWSDAAKQFMREAATATQVEMKDNQLVLVLEPEAASVICRQVKCRTVKQTDGTTKLDRLNTGHKYIILDLGGGTADIATHEALGNGKVCELNNTRGHNLAGQKFNLNFLNILYGLFGVDIVRKWQTLKHADYLKLTRAIEGCKWEISYSDEGTYFDLPYSLVKYFEDQSGKSYEEAIRNSTFGEQIELSDDFQIYIKSKLIHSLFDTILKGIVEHVNKISRESPGISTVFLVGGLSKSVYIYNYIQQQYPGFKMVVPEDTGLAVLKGAVLLGMSPETIESRLARYSYGIGVVRTFVKGLHKEEYRAILDGEEMCDNLFDKLIEKGSVLKYGDTFIATLSLHAKMTDTKAETIDFDIFQSEKPSPMYCTEDRCTHIGGLEISPPKGGWPDQCDFNIHIVVGEAEFKMNVSDDLGREFDTKVDFLGVSVY